MHKNSELAIAGAAAGLLGASAMSLFAASWHGTRRKSGQLFSGSQQEREATVNVASRVGRLLGRRMKRGQREIGAAIVHYGLGAALGAAYSLASARVPQVSMGRGALFGAAFWAGGDELLLPSLGLLHWPSTYPARAHLTALVEHVVYGVTTDLARRAAQKLL